MPAQAAIVANQALSRCSMDLFKRLLAIRCDNAMAKTTQQPKAFYSY
ncbi:hypothetical protein H6F38_20535 [Paenibacillus sp. EKM208P]|nr:hypothetical protein H6F38_20535 [Paenibacillus sp. EKM208P]